MSDDDAVAAGLSVAVAAWGVAAAVAAVAADGATVATVAVA